MVCTHLQFTFDDFCRCFNGMFNWLSRFNISFDQCFLYTFYTVHTSVGIFLRLLKSYVGALSSSYFGTLKTKCSSLYNYFKLCCVIQLHVFLSYMKEAESELICQRELKAPRRQVSRAGWDQPWFSQGCGCCGAVLVDSNIVWTSGAMPLD